MRWFCLCVPLFVCHAQQGIPDDLLLLAKIKVRMAENLDRLTNYTCSETIERSSRASNARKYLSLDTVRLEVALVEGKELYGWPGSHRISESELSTLVGGTIGNGAFGLLARSIFLGSSTAFNYVGPAVLQGQRENAIRYDYRVSQMVSGYHLKVAQNEAVVGYHGSFWVHPHSLDLIRLDLSADQIPEYLGLASAQEMLEYKRTKIGASEFLLPQGAELTMVDLHGIQSLNRTRFHDCRQYAGESVLSFADPPPDGPRDLGGPKIKDVQLPDDFGLELTLVTPIDSASSAVGDEVQLRLEHNFKYGRTPIAPKGAIISGRILKLYRQQRFFHVLIAPYSLDFEDRHADLSARENTVSMVLEAHPATMRGSRGYSAPAAPKSIEPIVIEGERLKLSSGYPLVLRSRLLKSDKQ